MANKPDQKNWLPLPKGEAHTLWPNGGTVVSDYGSRPTKDMYNYDRGDDLPLDPRRKLKKD